MRKAEFYQKLDTGEIKCLLCPNFCVLNERETGKCLARGVRGREMQLLNYGRVVAANLDPIEKKPLYHFLPTSLIFSVGSFGCNLKCRFCQNSDISQFEQPAKVLTPDKLVQLAFNQVNNAGVAFTYNEPGIWYEFVCDTAAKLRQAGLKTVLVTNGFLCHQPFSRLCQVTDAMNIDLKAFSRKFYLEVCQGDLETVKQNIITAFKAKVHIELTNLVITGLNDDEGEFCEMVDWIAELSDEIPLHVSRYFPRYHETAKETPIETILRFVELARQKLKFVYAGNLNSSQNTLCPECRKILIERTGYRTVVNLQENSCSCGYRIPLILK